MSVLKFFYICDTSDPELSASGLIDILEVILVDDTSAGRKIGSLNISHQFAGADVFIHDKGFHGIYCLTEIVRRDACCHTDCNAFRSVYEKIRNPAGKDFGFLFGLVKVGNKIDCILIEIVEKRKLGDLLKTGFGITHCCGSVSFDGSEVTVSVDKGKPLLEILAHYDKSFVYG